VEAISAQLNNFGFFNIYIKVVSGWWWEEWTRSHGTHYFISDNQCW